MLTLLTSVAIKKLTVSHKKMTLEAKVDYNCGCLHFCVYIFCSIVCFPVRPSGFCSLSKVRHAMDALIMTS